MPIFIPSLKRDGHLDDIKLTIFVVGSRKLEGEDYASQGWNLLAPNINIYGFDADPEACKHMNTELETRQVNWHEKHIPLALWNRSGKLKLYVTKYSACSSLYPPSQSYIDRFVGNSKMIELVSTEEVETTTLEKFCNSEQIEEIDFIQIDTQGGELNILEGASLLLEKSILAAKVEVEFTRLYDKQPLFSDVDTYLRSKGFSLFDLPNLHRDYRKVPLFSTEHPGQLIWSDAFYFKDLIHKNFNDSPLKTPDLILKLACIADILDFPDYALELLEYLTINYGENRNYNFADNIIEVLAQVPALIEQGLDSIPMIKRIRSFSSRSSTFVSLQIEEDFIALKLREVNLMIFPDWSSPEEYLFLELQQVIKATLARLDRDLITLLIDTRNIYEKDANLMLSSAVMNLMMEEDLDVSDGPELSLVGELSDIQWSALLPRIRARIVLENENKEAVAAAKAEDLPLWTLKNIN